MLDYISSYGLKSSRDYDYINNENYINMNPQSIFSRK